MGGTGTVREGVIAGGVVRGGGCGSQIMGVRDAVGMPRGVGSPIIDERAGVEVIGGGTGSQIMGAQQLVAVAPPESTIKLRIAF